MKALSIKQPYASLILAGRKTLEIRSWTTMTRGTIAVCSAKAPDKAGELRMDCTGPLGMWLGWVDLVNVFPFEPHMAPEACIPFRAGLYAWELKNPVRLQLDLARPVKGQLGFFDLDTALKKATPWSK